LIEELREILKEAQQTALYITHDQEEAFTISDKVVILGEGKAVQIGTPQEIYYHPKDPYVARFLGLTNLIEGRVDVSGKQPSVISTLGEWPYQGSKRGEGLILLRPDQMTLEKEKGTKLCQLSGILKSCSFSGVNFQIMVQSGDYQLKFILSNISDELPLVGDTIALFFDPNKAIHFYPSQRGEEYSN
jgi:ABC-type Fe3+/spermidine/putrescine transport system ATPase subunit